MRKLIDDIAIVESRAGVLLRDHLGFGNDPEVVIEYFKDQFYSSECIGEKNEENNPHGRSIRFYSNGSTYLGYFNNGISAPGKSLLIYSNGRILVGERYEK